MGKVIRVDFKSRHNQADGDEFFFDFDEAIKQHRRNQTLRCALIIMAIAAGALFALSVPLLVNHVTKGMLF